MSPNSETQFLSTILFPYGYNPNEQDCTQFLADLCQENPKNFLEICLKLVDLIGFHMLQNHSLPDNVLERIAKDFSQILPTLWKLQISSELVKCILHARNMANNACDELDKSKKADYIMNCFIAIDQAYKLLKGM